MSEADFDAGAHAREMSRLVHLPVEAAHLPGVAQTLRLAARMAAAIDGMTIPHERGAAPVFIAGRRA
ncbi:MAG TPA: AtzG-like protein [Roseomonas sp.]|jgi:hypothetical protein